MRPGPRQSGTIRVVGRGMGTAWVRCPLAVAITLVAARKVRVRWTNARVEALERRPLQCFRCMGKGHVKAHCESQVDRGSDCYRCGRPGHAARDCTAPVNCPVCADLGRPANHRAGSRACNVPKKKKEGQVAKPIPSAPSSSSKKEEERMDHPSCIKGGGHGV